MGKNSRHPWAVLKNGPPPLLHRDRTSYPHYKRADRVYSHWLAGYSAEEIASFFELTVEDVERDVQHVQGFLPTRTVIAQNNDRNRILHQRAEAEKYRKLLNQALSLPVEEYVAAGLSPAGWIDIWYSDCSEIFHGARMPAI